MAWPKLRNRSGAAHDGARSQEKAPEDAPEGKARLPFLRAQGARRAEGAGEIDRVEGARGTGGAEGLEWVEEVKPTHDAPVTWPGQAGDEAITAEETAADVAGSEAAGPEPTVA